MSEPQRKAGDPAELPVPTGPYAVGRVVYDWVDGSRLDPYARRSGTRRALSAVIWYPAEPTGGLESARYLPRGFWLHAALWGVTAPVRTHSFEDAPVAASEDRYPVLLFSPAGWPPYFYAATLEELASHGYIVVALQHTYEMVPTTVFASGRRRWFRMAAVAGAFTVSKRPHAEDVADRGAVVDYKADDLRFALDELAHVDRGAGPLSGRIDLQRVGAFGHSFGGGAAVVACQNDTRIAACANLDGGMWRRAERATVDRPALLMFAEHPEMTQPCTESVRQKMFSSVEWCEQDRALHLAAWEQLVTSATPGSCVQIRGAEHRTFMDWRVLPLRRWSVGRMGNATIDGHAMWSATTQCLRTLFDAHVRGVPAPSFEDLAADLPEITVGTPRTILQPAR